jgi:ubiquinone/menaquinone biosynthesis C-methylase UbiE
MYNEIAEYLISIKNEGSFLDIGTGGAFLLKSLFDLNSELDLHAIDINESMVHISKKNLEKFNITGTIKHMSIEETDYDSDTFDIVTCSSSFSYWNNPVHCLDEIYRILKKNGMGVLFEPYKELDVNQLKDAINEKLKDSSRVRRFLAIRINIFGLKYGHRLGLKLYPIKEIHEIIQRSKFKEDFKLEKVSLIDSPIFVRITLMKK